MVGVGGDGGGGWWWWVGGGEWWRVDEIFTVLSRDVRGEYIHNYHTIITCLILSSFLHLYRMVQTRRQRS